MGKMHMQVLEGGKSAGESGVKQCPRCGALLFDDMDVCYGCLYDFSAHPVVTGFELPAWDDRDVWMPEESGDCMPFSYVPREALDMRGRFSRIPDEIDQDWDPFVFSQDTGATDALRWVEGDENDVESDDTCFEVNPNARHYAVPENVDKDKRAKERIATQDTMKLDCPAHMKSRWALTVEAGSVRMLRPVPSTGLSVGRSQENDIVLCDRTVSRNHLRMFPALEGVRVVDQGATNPATIGGLPVEGSRLLKEGEPLIVGKTVFFLVPFERKAA